MYSINPVNNQFKNDNDNNDKFFKFFKVIFNKIKQLNCNFGEYSFFFL